MAAAELMNESFMRPGPMVDRRWNMRRRVSLGAVSEAHDDEDLDIPVSSGMYCSALVAVFGGTHFHIKTKDSFGKMHPFFLWLCCIPLFLAQLTILFVLRTNMNFHEKWYDKDLLGEDYAKRTHLFQLKLLMSCILYLTNFTMMLGTARRLLFAMNPLIWFSDEHEQDSTDDCAERVDRLVRRRCFRACWGLLSVWMECLICYMVCTDQMSFIMSSKNVQDVILNSLAIVFILELNPTWWGFLSSVLHLSMKEDFKFQAPQAENEPMNIGASDRTSLLGFCRWWVRSTRRLGLGKVFPYALLCLIYQRQFFVALQALDTGHLPVARDLCTRWRMVKGKLGMVSKLWQSFEKCLYISMMFDTSANREYFEKNCDDGESWDRLKLEEYPTFAMKYWRPCVCFHIAILSVLVVPHYVYMAIGCVYYGKVGDLSEASSETSDGEETESVAASDMQQQTQMDPLLEATAHEVREALETKCKLQEHRRKLDKLVKLEEGRAAVSQK